MTLQTLKYSIYVNATVCGGAQINSKSWFELWGYKFLMNIFTSSPSSLLSFIKMVHFDLTKLTCLYWWMEKNDKMCLIYRQGLKTYNVAKFSCRIAWSTKDSHFGHGRLFIGGTIGNSSLCVNHGKGWWDMYWVLVEK